jgi:hypothetical protein
VVRVEASSFTDQAASTLSSSSRFVGQCQDTASRFCGVSAEVPTGLDCVSYSRVATGAFWDTLLVVASGAPFIPHAEWCLTRSRIICLAIMNADSTLV